MKKKIYYLPLWALISLFISFSCQNEEEVNDNIGYLRLSVGTTVSTTTTKVAADYNPERLAVEITDQAGTVVDETDDYATWGSDKTFALREGTYTIKASSYNFDGSEAGFDIPYYVGSTTVNIQKNQSTSAVVKCTLANVKVTVLFDASLDVFSAMAVTVVGSTTMQQCSFVKGNSKSAYFPVQNLTANLSVTNSRGESHTLTREITGVQARDHYILNYRLGDSGSGKITVEADDKETTYTYTFEVPTTATTKLQVNTPAILWSQFAHLVGEVASKVADLPAEHMKFEWQKKGDTAWTSLAATPNGEDKYTAVLNGLLPATEYSYRLVYSDGTDNYVSDAKTFVTAVEEPLYNGSLDNWYQSGKTWYAISETDYSAGFRFWDSSNPGTTTGAGALVNINPTTGVSSPARSGKAAQLKSYWVNVMGITKFAAASLYVGEFGGLNGTNGAKINFGRSFPYRPTALKGWYQYTTAAINRIGANQPANTIVDGQDDLWSAYVVLTTGTYTLDNTDMAGTSKDFNALLHDDTDDFVVAYGALPDAQCVQASDWTSFEIPLVYKNLTAKPTHLIIVFSSSKYGDYFTGSDSSELYLDDLELVYDGEPSLK